MKLVIDNSFLYSYLLGKGKKLDYTKLQEFLQAQQVAIYLQRNGEDTQLKFIEYLQRLGWEVNLGSSFSADLGWEIGNAEVPISLLTDDATLIRPLSRASVRHRLVGFSTKMGAQWFPFISARKVDFLNLEPFDSLFIDSFKKAGVIPLSKKLLSL